MHLGGAAAGTMNTPRRNTTWNPSQESEPAFWRRECRGSGKIERPPSSLLIWALVWPSSPCFIPNLSVTEWNWVRFHKTGYQFRIFAGSYFDEDLFKRTIWVALKVQVR
jgi:hypothetical protein